MIQEQSLFTVRKHVIECSHIREYPRATASETEGPLSLCIKQYIPINNPNPRPGDITIIGAHGSGLPKELYEPLWQDLILQSEQRGIKIRGIWIADVAHQGASGVLNERKLGNDPSWFDHCRDLLCMVDHFREQLPRPIIGIGHSMGASQLVLLSLMHPRLFASLILYEPVIGKCTKTCQGPTLCKASTFRKDLWPSREEADRDARKRFKTWDSRVHDLWAEHGLRSVPTVLYDGPELDINGYCADMNSRESPAVTLTTTKHQEVFSYLRPNYNAFTPKQHPRTVIEQSLSTDSTSAQAKLNIIEVDRLFHPDIVGPADTITPFYRAEPIVANMALPHVRPSVLYVFGDRSPVSTSALREEKLATTGTGVGGSGGKHNCRVEELVIAKAGHLLPLEKVSECAEAAVPWLRREQDRWRDEEERIAKGWAERSAREKSMVDEVWIRSLKALL